MLPLVWHHEENQKESWGESGEGQVRCGKEKRTCIVRSSFTVNIVDFLEFSPSVTMKGDNFFCNLSWHVRHYYSHHLFIRFVPHSINMPKSCLVDCSYIQTCNSVKTSIQWFYPKCTVAAAEMNCHSQWQIKNYCRHLSTIAALCPSHLIT